MNRTGFNTKATLLIPRPCSLFFVCYKCVKRLQLHHRSLCFIGFMLKTWAKFVSPALIYIKNYFANWGLSNKTYFDIIYTAYKFNVVLIFHFSCNLLANDK